MYVTSCYGVEGEVLVLTYLRAGNVQADATAERVGIPVEARTDKPLGLTLSEIIRKARNEKAREEPIDLTGDDEPELVAQPTNTSADDPQPCAQS